MNTRRLTSSAALLALFVGVTLAPARPDPPRSADPPMAGDLLVASLDVAKVWEHKAFAPVREARGKLEFAWAVQSLLGLAPTELERVTLVQTRADGPLVVGLTGRKAIDPAAVAKTLTRTPRIAGPKPPIGGAAVAPGAEFPFVVPVTARTVLLAPEGVTAAELSRLGKVVAGESKHALAVRLDGAGLKALLGDQLPDGLRAASSAELTADLPDDRTAKLALSLTYADAAGAKKAVPAVASVLKDVAKWAAGREQASNVGATGAFARPLFEGLAKTAKVAGDGPRVVVSADLDAADLVARVVTATPDAVLTGQGGSVAENNLKQILLAMHNHESAFNRLPANSYDKDGKPLLSWRVHILPYIEQDAVYRQFKLDEPWDSPHNLPLSKVVMKVFAVPGRVTEPGHTYFRAFIGPKNVKPEYRPWLTEGDSKGISLLSITDGTSNTIVVAEAAESVPYSKPDDLVYDGVVPVPALGGPTGRFLVGFGDGSVRTLRRDRVDDKNLRAMITVAGGEIITIP